MIWFSWHRTYFSLFFISWFTASRQKMNSLHFVLLNQGRMEKTGLIIFYSNPTYRYHLSLSPVRSDMSAISYWGGCAHSRFCLFTTPALHITKLGDEVLEQFVAGWSGVAGNSNSKAFAFPFKPQHGVMEWPELERTPKDHGVQFQEWMSCSVLFFANSNKNCKLDCSSAWCLHISIT